MDKYDLAMVFDCTFFSLNLIAFILRDLLIVIFRLDRKVKDASLKEDSKNSYL
jgi:hypothetical protein